MPLTKERSTYLLDAWVNQKASPAEQQELFQWVQEHDRKEEMSAYLTTMQGLAKGAGNYQDTSTVDWDILFNKIMLGRQDAAMPESLLDWEDSHSGKVVAMEPGFTAKGKWRRWGWVAAALLFVIGTGTIWMLQFRTQPSLITENTPITESIQAGREGAILTLADGTQVLLDSAANGVIATQNGAQVLMHNNQLTYQSAAKSSDSTLLNTMRTPRGRHYKVQLPDGSIAWLNASSSITYPTSFGSNNRSVEVTGEVYFEVTRNSAAPFTVRVKDRMDIEVLGTSFNVQAYENELTLQTTLIEGRVKVNGALLQPGEQAQLSNTKATNPEAPKVVRVADLNGVLAWKNGLFDFRGKGIEELMRQLERWYDIEVVYPNGVPAQKFDGKISRDLSLKDVLEGLKTAGVRSKMEDGRRVVVLP